MPARGYVRNVVVSGKAAYDTLGWERSSQAACIASIARQAMDTKMQDRQDHFAYCVQLFGGTTAFARRLRIDERAIRRFINGERPIGDGLLRDTAKALGELAAEANAAAETISANLTSKPSDP